MKARINRKKKESRFDSGNQSSKKESKEEGYLFIEEIKHINGCNRSLIGERQTQPVIKTTDCGYPNREGIDRRRKIPNRNNPNRRNPNHTSNRLKGE